MGKNLGLTCEWYKKRNFGQFWGFRSFPMEGASSSTFTNNIREFRSWKRHLWTLYWFLGFTIFFSFLFHFAFEIYFYLIFIQRIFVLLSLNSNLYYLRIEFNFPMFNFLFSSLSFPFENHEKKDWVEDS